MNMLNSVILEGETKKDQHYNFTDNEQKTFCMFTVTTKRTVPLENGSMGQVNYLIPCRAVGTIAESINRILNNTDRQGVRVVGHLKSDESGIYIFVEHIEYKLSIKTK